MNPSPQDVTQLLVAWSNGDQVAWDELMSVVYQELHRLAHHYMKRESADLGNFDRKRDVWTCFVNKLRLKTISGRIGIYPNGLEQGLEQSDTAITRRIKAKT